MNQKTGRNDPCPCGSGKKYKQCCLSKDMLPKSKKKLTAKWINAPEAPNLMNRTFGDAVASAGKVYTPPSKILKDITPEKEDEQRL